MKHFFVLVALLFAFEQGEVYGQVTMETFKSKSQIESKRYFSSRMDEAKAKEKSGDLKELFLFTPLWPKKAWTKPTEKIFITHWKLHK